MEEPWQCKTKCCCLNLRARKKKINKIKETQALPGKTMCESEACGEGSDGNRNLFATSFCLNICKQKSWMGERMLTCWRDLIQRMSVGVAVGSSVSCHILMNKGLYRKLFFFLCQLYYFLKSWMIYGPCDRDGAEKNKYVMPFCTWLNPL